MCSCPEDEIIQLSAVQHVAFCERQCYLIHVEQIWSENFFTVSGSLSHQRVDSEETTYTADGLKQVRSLLLNSAKYGLSGRADLIEFDSAGRAYPVEYKIGRPKLDDCDAVQLCAQAFCLEEMLHIPVPCGAVYYGRTRQRMEFELNSELRGKTEEWIRRAHELFHLAAAPPPPEDETKCRSCSLRDLCVPELRNLKSPETYIRNFLREDVL